MVKETGKRGDTLIEVTIAVGIFSMVAIAITAVMSSGSAGSQTALETTLTREEIDTQAEALRFIQTAYTVNRGNAERSNYAALWKEITDNAIDLTFGLDEDEQTQILQYTPETCEDTYDATNPNAKEGIYANEQVRQHAFVINPRKLGSFDLSNDTNKNVKSVYIAKKDLSNENKLTSAQIYPRLVYGNSSVSDDQGGYLVVNEENNIDTLRRAEGIYIIAVKDSKTTKIATSMTEEGEDIILDKQAAFYDFYIRTCWYGTNAAEPTTISTVIRLYDPDIIVQIETPEEPEEPEPEEP